MFRRNMYHIQVTCIKNIPLSPFVKAEIEEWSSSLKPE